MPIDLHLFWNGFSIERLFALLRASPKKVIGKFIEPFAVDADQQRVLTTFVGNLSGSDLTAFVHIVTGSSSMMSKDITILFQEWHDDLSATPAVTFDMLPHLH